MNYSDDTSCSDCKLEIIEKRWTDLLLHWLNKCVLPLTPIKELNARSLVEIVDKYGQDICIDDVDRAILFNDDIDSFVKYKYPILRLRYFWEIKDMPKKMYIMHTIMLFHCCISSTSGSVDNDICVKLEKHEQEMILKFCERLNDMEVTANNIECAIKDACEIVKQPPKSPKRKKIKDQGPPQIEPDSDANLPSPPTSPDKPSISSMASDTSPENIKKKFNALKFKSSVTVLPSVMTDTSSYSELDYEINYLSKSDINEKEPYDTPPKVHEKEPYDAMPKIHEKEPYDATPKVHEKEPFDAAPTVQHVVEQVAQKIETESAELKRRCQPNCACSRCSPNGPCCGDPGSSVYQCDEGNDRFAADKFKDKDKPDKGLSWFRKKFNWKVYLVLAVSVMVIVIVAILLTVPWQKKPVKLISTDSKMVEFRMSQSQEPRVFKLNSYICKKGLCEKVFQPTSETVYSSMSRCVLQCMGPQLWPYPIGYTYFSKKIVSLATNRLEYKFQSVPSEAVHLYLAEAFKLFLGDLAKLERYTLEARKENLTRDMMIKKMYIQMDVETDPDPRIRLDTEESYTIKIDTINSQVTIKLLAASFCGMRHALETLSQLIMLDQTTGYLITLSNIVIKDAPSYKYRGLMIDTGRNYIPVRDIMRTIDAMAMVKLNTFHWRISDVTSFSLYLPAVPQLFEYGAYDRTLVYTKDDVRAVVKRAGIRGIRVLLEVAAPGPVGRAWSWVPEATCPTKNKNFTCNNVLCLRLGIHDSVFDILQIIYTEILEMTRIEDVFHLSDSVFSLANCFYLIEEREGFLDKALERLRLANKGFLPKLPIIWYTTHLTKDFEARTWDRFGVQLTEWQPNPSDQFLSRYKVIHSSRWDLSCDIKKQRCRKYRTWQDMYSWKSWRNIEVFTIEGGEAILWTDLVDSGNLDYHLWPRAAAVAERLWSDIALNGTVSGPVYVRLDSHRWRMVLKSVQVQPVWPLYCSLSPGICLEQLRNK